MLPIYVCDDRPEELFRYNSIIQGIIEERKLEGNVVFAGQNPYELIKYLKLHRQKSLFVLDVNLNQEINGIELGKCIREICPESIIIMLTTHDEMSYLVFRYKVKAMDYILKDRDDVKQRLTECMEDAFYQGKTEINNNKNEVRLKNGKVIPTSDIYYISAEGHGVKIKIKEGILLLNIPLKSIGADLPDTFYQCHRSCVVNMEKVIEIDTSANIIYLEKGLKCPLSKRNIKDIIKRYKNIKLDIAN